MQSPPCRLESVSFRQTPMQSPSFLQPIEEVRALGQLSILLQMHFHHPFPCASNLTTQCHQWRDSLHIKYWACCFKYSAHSQLCSVREKGRGSVQRSIPASWPAQPGHRAFSGRLGRQHTCP